MQRVSVLLLKVVATALLIYLSVHTVSLETLSARFANLHWGWMSLMLGVLAGQIALQATRWQTIVHAVGAPFSVTASQRITYIAAFFNQTLPSTIGGDTARIWLLAREQKAGWRFAAYSVLVDRTVGVFALTVLVLVLLPWTFDLISDPLARTTILLIGGGGVTGGLAFAALSAGLKGWLNQFWLTRHFVAASGILRALLAQPSRAAFVVGASIVIHIATVFVAWTAARTIGTHLDFIVAMCLLPPVVLLATIPVSIAGWGLREGLMITTFTLSGNDAGDALAISLIMGAANFAVGLCGGLIWLLTWPAGVALSNQQSPPYERR